MIHFCVSIVADFTKIETIRMPSDPDAKNGEQNKGFAYIEFKKIASAKKAMQQLYGKVRGRLDEF